MVENTTPRSEIDWKDDTQTVEIARKVFEGTKDENIHALHWKANEDDRESGIIYTVKIAFPDRGVSVVLVEGYNHTRAFYGHVEYATEAFVQEVEDSNREADIVDSSEFDWR